MNLMFQKRMSRFFILGILVSIVLLASPALAGLNIINAKYSGTASPGDIIPFKMTVSTSASDPPMDVSVDVMGFGQAPDKSYSPLAPESDTSPYSARTYITLDASTLSLNPGEPKDGNQRAGDLRGGGYRRSSGQIGPDRDRFRGRRHSGQLRQELHQSKR